MGLVACSSHETPISVSHPSRLNSGTHKNLQRLVICPIYSVVKYRPRELASTHPHSAGMGLTDPRVCKLQNPSNPMFGANFIDAQHQIESSVGQIFGGADRDRTGGLLVANQALSQLSYSPIASFKVSRFKVFEP